MERSAIFIGMTFAVVRPLRNSDGERSFPARHLGLQTFCPFIPIDRLLWMLTSVKRLRKRFTNLFWWASTFTSRLPKRYRPHSTGTGRKAPEQTLAQALLDYQRRCW